MPARKGQSFRLLHRYGGLSSAAFVILLCLTGILLNHADELGLGKRTVGNVWLLDWYGIELPAALTFSDREATATQLDAQLYAGTTALPRSTGRLRGIVRTPAGIFIATDSELLVLTRDGRYIETLDRLYGLPAGIRRIGVANDNHVLLDTAHGLWRGDQDLATWRPASATAARWSATAALPATDMSLIAQHYRGTGLTFERVILDLHSGRILGRAGPWLADAAAIVFILLAMTGIWMWFRTRRRNT